MAIRIGSCIEFQGKYFLDQRQGIAKSTDDLLNWEIPVPEGFEVYLEGEWYTYKTNYSSDVTGHFYKRDQRIEDTEIDLSKLWKKVGELEEKDVELEGDIDNLQDSVTIINNTLDSFYADTTQDLLRESEWVIDGKSYVKKGIIVSVINDPDAIKNGAYILKNDDFTSINNWIKLIDRNDLIISSDYSTQSNDTLVYSSKKTDNLFFRKDIPQTVTQEWTHTRNIIMGNKVDGKGIMFVKDTNPNSKRDLVYGIFDNITANTSDILDLPDQIFKYMQQVGVTNLLKNTGFLGNYEYLNLKDNTRLDEGFTEVWGDQEVFWEGCKTWELIKTEEAVFGYGVKLTEPYSFLKQTINTKNLITGESYVISFKGFGKINIQIDGKQFFSRNEGTEEYRLEKFRFSYSGDSNIFVEFTGTGTLCNIKLERGTIATDWMPCETDKTPDSEQFQTFDYLKTAFKENGPLGNNLKNLIFFGNTEGGISGIWGSKVMMWSGGDYEDACRVLSRLENNERGPIDTGDTKSIITFDGKIYGEKIKNIHGDIIVDIVESINENKDLLGKTEEFPLFSLDSCYLIILGIKFSLGTDKYVIDTRENIIPRFNKEFKSVIYKNDIPQGNVEWALKFNRNTLKYYLEFKIIYPNKTETDYTKITDLEYNNGKTVKIIPI